MFISRGRYAPPLVYQDDGTLYGSLQRSNSYRPSQQKYCGRMKYDPHLGAYVQEIRPSWTSKRESNGRSRSISYGMPPGLFGQPSNQSFQRRPSVKVSSNQLASLFGLSNKTYSQAAMSDVLGYQFVKSLKTGGMSEAINLVSKSGRLYIQKRVSTVDKRSRPHRISQSLMRTIQNELAALRKMPRGQNLNYLLGSSWSSDNSACTFVLEYCDRGTLADMLDSTTHWKRLNEDLMWHILLGVAKGLSYMHYGVYDVTSNTIGQFGWDAMWHLDLKPQNIFLSSSGQRGAYPRIVLGDFGCVVFASDIKYGRVDSHRQPCGTEEWYPPEERKSELAAGRGRYGSATDMWQLGATIHTMCRKIHNPDWRVLGSNWSPVCGGSYSEHLNTAIRNCTLNDWRKRYNAVQVAQLALHAASQLDMPNIL